MEQVTKEQEQQAINIEIEQKRKGIELNKQ